MNTFLIVLHVMVCVVLILVVLLQRGKGSDMGAALGGGGSNTVFGGRGAGNFLTKLTTGAAIGFMLTSFSLSFITNRDANVLVFDEETLEELAPSEAEGAASADALEEVDIEPLGGADDELVEIDVEATDDEPTPE
jgi:preprotein translocase subunit SecG